LGRPDGVDPDEPVRKAGKNLKAAQSRLDNARRVADANKKHAQHLLDSGQVIPLGGDDEGDEAQD
jgi:hypothetical protein